MGARPMIVAFNDPRQVVATLNALDDAAAQHRINGMMLLGFAPMGARLAAIVIAPGDYVRGH